MRYELRPAQRFLSLVFLPFLLVVGVSMLVGFVRDGAAVGVAFVVVWLGFAVYQGWYMLWRMPTAIEVDEGGIRFVTRGGTTVVPWSELRSVSSPWWDFNGQVWVWRWRDGKRRSWGTFRNGHRLLNDVERHAPHTEVVA